MKTNYRSNIYRSMASAFASFAIAAFLTGCASTNTTRLSDSVPQDIARIFIHRNWNMVGAVVPHQVIDKGDGITDDVTILQKEVNLDERGNRNRIFNVKSVLPGVASDIVSPDANGRFRIPAKGVGSIGAGDHLIYERPPGTMKLEIFSPNGDQAFAPWVNVEGGKTYRVEYYYLGPKFDIIELQTGKPVRPVGSK
jgi:hypothetical protein